jgi:hypothetical protein
MLGMPYAWGLLGLLILFFFIHSMFQSQIALFLSARFSWHGHPFGARELSGVFAYAGFINIIVQGLLMTRANSLASDRTIVVAAFACMAVGFSGIAVVAGVGLLALFLIPIIVRTMFIRTTLTAELSRSVPLNRQGMIMGFNQSLMSSANIVAPLLSGVLIGHRLYVHWAMAMAAIATCSAAAAAVLLAPPRAESGFFGQTSRPSLANPLHRIAKFKAPGRTEHKSGRHRRAWHRPTHGCDVTPGGWQGRRRARCLPSSGSRRQDCL